MADHSCPLCDAKLPVSMEFHMQDPDDRAKTRVLRFRPATIAKLKDLGIDLATAKFKIMTEKKDGT